MSQRAMTYLNNKRIVYRRYSPDEPTTSYDWGWYYADGTYGYYSLFNTKAKIISYRALKWHLLFYCWDCKASRVPAQTVADKIVRWR